MSRVKFGVYVPWERPVTRSDAKARSHTRSLPSVALTCWQLNTKNTASKVPSCSPCALFLQEKALNSRLRKLSSNKEAPYRYRCQSPWTEDRSGLSTAEDRSGVSNPPCPGSTKRKSRDAAASSKKKKNKTSPRDSVPQSESPLPAAPAVALPAAAPPAVVAHPAPPPVDSQRNDSSLTAYLMKRVASRDNAVAMEKQKLGESQVQVLRLRRLLAKKVESLQLEVNLAKAKVSTLTEEVEVLKCEKAVLAANQDSLTAASQKQLEDVLLERSLVARLKLELETATVGTITAPETIDDLAKSVEALVQCTTNKRCHLSTKVKVICESVLSSVYDGKCRAYLTHKASGVVKRENPYRSAMKIAKVIDLSGSLLNISGYNALRKGVEGDGDGKIERNGGWLASKYHLMRAMKLVEEAASTVIPFAPTIASENDDGIDGVQFDYGKLLTYLLRLYGLDTVALDPHQPPVEFSITLDGADLSRNISHVTAGIKINDRRAIDPLTGIPIGFQDSTKLQSRELCWPVKILIAKDTKVLYKDYFTDFFEFFKGVEENGFGEFTRPFIVSSPQDLSSFWKVYKKGGACKQKIEFCHICSCKSTQCYLPRQDRCERCVRNGRQDCYHWVEGDPATLLRVQTKLDSMISTHPFLSDVTIQGRLRLHMDNNQLTKTRDMSNINFLPETPAERREFSEQFINHDLGVLQLSRLGGLEDRRSRVLAILRAYDEAASCRATVEAGNYAGAFISIRQGIPCILHLENRCGEKKLKMVLLEGYDLLPTDAAKNKYLKEFETLVNTRVLGTLTRPANWRLATGKDKDNRQCIKDQTLPNTHVRKFMHKFEILATFCISSDEDRRSKWIETISLWNLVMDKARRREDFDEGAIEDFQTLADDWFEKWIRLTGRDGLSNYVHIVASGHLSFYLREWGNLYKYSQQGWESFNSLIKSIYFRRTQRGGSGGKRDELNSRVAPIARWLQRKLFFLSGDYRQCEDC
jgi:hypothetical protein